MVDGFFWCDISSDILLDNIYMLSMPVATSLIRVFNRDSFIAIGSDAWLCFDVAEVAPKKFNSSVPNG